MQMCQQHWDMMRASIDAHGMGDLGAKTGEAAAEAIVAEIETGQTDKNNFDPLMSMNWHWFNSALQNGGLYLMGVDDKGNHFCPICEFVKNMKGFEPQKEIDNIAVQMQAWCRTEGLIPRVS